MKIKMLRDVGRPGYPGTVNGEKMGPYRKDEVLEVGVQIPVERAELFVHSVMAEEYIPPAPKPIAAAKPAVPPPIPAAAKAPAPPPLPADKPA